jgi:hypothetical protein
VAREKLEAPIVPGIGRENTAGRGVGADCCWAIRSAPVISTTKS